VSRRALTISFPLDTLASVAKGRDQMSELSVALVVDQQRLSSWLTLNVAQRATAPNHSSTLRTVTCRALTDAAPDKYGWDGKRYALATQVDLSTPGHRRFIARFANLADTLDVQVVPRAPAVRFLGPDLAIRQGPRARRLLQNMLQAAGRSRQKAVRKWPHQ
jgi:hypothetical protein